MDRIIKHGADYIKQEEKRIKSLLRGKVTFLAEQKKLRSAKLDDDTRHANAEGDDFVRSRFTTIGRRHRLDLFKSRFEGYFDTVSMNVSVYPVSKPEQ